MPRSLTSLRIRLLLAFATAAGGLAGAPSAAHADPYLSYCATATAWVSAQQNPSGFHSCWQVQQQAGDAITVTSAEVTVDGNDVSSSVSNQVQNGGYDATVKFAVNLSRLSDGTHDIEMNLTDSTGNTYDDNETLNVQNEAPVSVSGLRAAASATNSWKLSWRAPSNDAAPLTDVYYSTVRPTSASRAPAGTVTVSDPSQASSVAGVELAKGARVWVWVGDAAGNADPTTAQSVMLGATSLGRPVKKRPTPTPPARTAGPSVLPASGLCINCGVAIPRSHRG